jgi:hypothetical protein
MTADPLQRPQRSQGRWPMMRNRTGPRRGVKVHRSYEVVEVARLLDVSKRTVRRWIKAGLAAITDQKPTLILGEDVLAFLAARKNRSRRCQPEECYCVKCRSPRRPAGDMAEFIPLTIKTGNLRAICPVCGSLMHKRIRCDAVEALRWVLDVTVAQAAPSLEE